MTKPKFPRVKVPPPTKVVPDKTKVTDRPRHYTVEWYEGMESDDAYDLECNGGSTRQKLRRQRNEE